MADPAIVAYQVLQHPNLGLSLLLNRVYTIEQLEKRTTWGKSCQKQRLSKLHEKLRQPDLFRPIMAEPEPPPLVVRRMPVQGAGVRSPASTKAVLLPAAPGLRYSCKRPEFKAMAWDCSGHAQEPTAWRYMSAGEGVQPAMQLPLRLQPCTTSGLSGAALEPGEVFAVSEVRDLRSNAGGSLWLRVADGSGWAFDRDSAAAQPLCAPAQIYRSLGLRLPGDKPGDEVFRHPEVQTLLASAKARVLELLETQRGPPNDRWILCVRTYGRSGIGLGDVAEDKKGILQLTLAGLELALGPALVRERCFIFVSHEDRDVKRGRYDMALRGTLWADRIVVGVKGADLQVRFIEESAPFGTHVVVVDDNVTKFMVESGCPAGPGVTNRVLQAGSDDGTSDTPELAALIVRAGQEMNMAGAKLWGICPSHNPLITHTFGEGSRRRAAGGAISECDWSKNLGLVYGAFFGLRVAHDPARYTRYGQVRDDVERSLRYWHADKVVVRFQRYCVLKSQKPGLFIKGKGGISAGSNAQWHADESERALRSILSEFAWPYARLPRHEENRKVLYGLCWKASANKEGCKHNGQELVATGKVPAASSRVAAVQEAPVVCKERERAQKHRKRTLARGTASSKKAKRAHFN